MFRFMVIVLVLLSLAVGVSAQCGGELEPTCEPPPTETETPTITPTPTETLTPTPDVVIYATIVPPGSEGDGTPFSIRYEVTVGEATIIILLFASFMLQMLNFARGLTK